MYEDALGDKGGRIMMQELRFHETEQTYISVYKGKVFIKDTYTGEISPRAITICPGFQIETGRNYHEFSDALMESRAPVFFQEVLNHNQQRHMFIVRMQTGKVPSTNLVAIVCEDDIITRVAFLQQIKEDKEYLQYAMLPDYCDWVLPAGDSEEEKNARKEEAINFLLNRFPMITGKDIEIKDGSATLEINVTHKLVGMRFTFVSSSKDAGRYVCVGVE